MNFIEFMSDKFTTEELLEWAVLYRGIYIELDDVRFAMTADALLNEALRLSKKEK